MWVYFLVATPMTLISLVIAGKWEMGKITQGLGTVCTSKSLQKQETVYETYETRDNGMEAIFRRMCTSVPLYENWNLQIQTA